MGCSSSKVVEIGNGAQFKHGSTKTHSKSTSPPKDKNSLTVKEFFDTVLVLPDQHGEAYIQPELPEFYVEHTLSFENESVDNNIWNTRITLDRKSKGGRDGNIGKKNNESEITWHYRKPPNRKYIEPHDCATIDVEYEQGAKKKHIMVVGGLYLGSKAACPDNALETIDVESTHSLVLLGNLFDMLSIDCFHQTPTDSTKIENILGAAESILSTIRRLAEEMNVYYMLGSHDADLTRVAMERLLGNRVKYIPQTNLILCVKAGNESYRVRLTTGQQWDFLNNKTLNSQKLLAEKPIGHYLSRAAANNPTFSASALMKPLVSALPAEIAKGYLQQISKRPLQDKITGRMLLCAFQLTKPEELISIKCLIDEGKYISIQSILEYPYIKYLLEQHGEQALLSMFEAMIGNYSTIAHGFGEDVLIAGLGDEATLSKVPTESGQEIISAGTGSCSRRSNTMTMLKVLYPKQGSNGKVEIIPCQQQPVPEQNSVNKIETVTEDKLDTLSVESL